MKTSTPLAPLSREPNRRILVVDDNASIHEDFRKILSPAAKRGDHLKVLESALFGEASDPDDETAAGFPVECAFQGAEALEKVIAAKNTGAPYALAFVDVRMPPGWDGVETAQRLWQADPDIEIVICTAYADYSWQDFFEKLNRPEHLLILKKPFDHVEVLQLAHSLTRKWNLGRDLQELLLSLNSNIADKTQQLGETQKKMELILNAIDEGICGLDTRDAVTFINPSVARLTHMTPDDLLGKPIGDIILPRAERGPSPMVPEGPVLVRRDAAPLPVEFVRSPIHEGGQTVGSVITFRDVSETKRLQAQLLQSQKLEALGQLAAGVAHEINNPLSYVLTNLGSLSHYVDTVGLTIEKYSALIGEIMKDDAPGLTGSAKEIFRFFDRDKFDFIRDDLKALLSETLEGANRVKEIVAGLRTFARADESERQKIDVNVNLDNTLKLIGNELRFRCRVVKDYGELPPLTGYPTQLSQVFMNLLMNAAQAIEGQGDITIRTRTVGGDIVVAISDTGKGIKPSDLAKLFTPFFTTKPPGQGTGLGLSVSYTIVQKHGGRIEAESEPGEGTTFTVILPADVAVKPLGDRDKRATQIAEQPRANA